MHARCYKPSVKAYKWYGGRGITVEAEWHDFDAFCHWSLKHGSAKGLQIDRIDANGPYGPSNCRWVSVKVNQNNRRNNRIVEAWGESKTLAEWIEDSRVTVTYRQAENRLRRGGWDPERALTAPIDPTRKPVHKTHCKRGHEYTDANTYTTPSQPNIKKCRKCHAERQSARYHESTI